MDSCNVQGSCFCGCAADLHKPGSSQPELPANAGKDTLDRLDKLRYSSGSQSTAEIRGNMQKTMQEHAAVFRTAVSFHHPYLPTALKLHSILGNQTSFFEDLHVVMLWLGTSVLLS